jgi:hypothetical protein
MRVINHLVARAICWLIAMAAVTAVGVTLVVYSGPEHREAMQGIAREFFVLVERASRVRHLPANASVSPTPAPGGGVIQ